MSKLFISCDWLAASLRCSLCITPCRYIPLSAIFSTALFVCQIQLKIALNLNLNCSLLSSMICFKLHFWLDSLKWQKLDYFPSSFVSSLSSNKQAAPHIFYGKLYLMLGGQVYPLDCYFTFSLFL